METRGGVLLLRRVSRSVGMVSMALRRRLRRFIWGPLDVDAEGSEDDDYEDDAAGEGDEAADGADDE